MSMSWLEIVEVIHSAGVKSRELAEQRCRQRDDETPIDDGDPDAGQQEDEHAG
jgi:hypothetical protein